VPENQITAERHSRYFYSFLFLPLGLGFDACQVRRHATVFSADGEAAHVFLPAVSVDEIRAALSASGYRAVSESNVEVFEAPLREEDEFGYADQVKYLTFVGPHLVSSSNRAHLVEVAEEASVSAVSGPEGEVLRALEPFDAAWILPPGQPEEVAVGDLVLRLCGLNCTEEQASAIRESIVDSAREAGWSNLPRPDRVAVAFHAGDEPEMKVALIYEGHAPMLVVDELKRRLETDEPITDRKLCGSADATQQVSGDAEIVVGICRGGDAESWYEVLNPNNNLLLVEQVQ
jgi:hypothetical protein